MRLRSVELSSPEIYEFIFLQQVVNTLMKPIVHAGQSYCTSTRAVWGVVVAIVECDFEDTEFKHSIESERAMRIGSLYKERRVEGPAFVPDNCSQFATGSVPQGTTCTHCFLHDGLSMSSPTARGIPCIGTFARIAFEVSKKGKLLPCCIMLAEMHRKIYEL